MASADEIRRFATAKFRDELLRRRFEPHTNRSGAELMIEIGERFEDWGWLAAGVRIGYFDESYPEFDLRPGAPVIERVMSSPEAISWPASFRSLANSFSSRSSEAESNQNWQYTPEFSDEELAERRTFFQSIMITAEGFRDPLIRSLQWSLITSHSILDEPPGPIDPEEVFRVFEDFGRETTLASLVAGLADLMAVLVALDETFTARGEGPVWKNVIHEVSPLLLWRLNLQDRRLVRRLGVVSRAFWQVVETEFSKHPELRWSSEASRVRWQKILLTWRYLLFEEHAENDQVSPDSEFLWTD